MRSLLLAPVALIAFSTVSEAQLQLPKKSPQASVTQFVATTEVKVDYHRPAVRGRKVWGELVPFDQVWRAGANAATTIAFSGDVKIAGKELPKGSYAFFVTPREKGAWTVVFNSVDNQWGAYNRDPKLDVLSFDVLPTAAPNQEYLRFSVEPLDVGKAELSLAWEKLRIAFPIEVDVHEIMSARITEAISKAGPDDWQVYYQAASYHYDNDLDLMQALTWINKSVEMEQSTRNLVLLARVLHATGAVEEALPPMKRAIELARGSAPAEYVEGLERTVKEWEAAR